MIHIKTTIEITNKPVKHKKEQVHNSSKNLTIFEKPCTSLCKDCAICQQAIFWVLYKIQELKNTCHVFFY